MYLLDKKIYLKNYNFKKIASGQTRRVPNPGYWHNKDQISRQSIRHTTPELQITFWVDHHFTMQIQSHNARFLGGSHFWVLLVVPLGSHFWVLFDTFDRNFRSQILDTQNFYIFLILKIYSLIEQIHRFRPILYPSGLAAESW